MTPHELINLPGAGNARRKLIEQGKWKHLLTDEERIDWLQDNMIGAVFDNFKGTWNITFGDLDCYYSTMRLSIDNAASKAMEAQQ